MNFDRLVKYLLETRKNPLPGRAAHMIMAPEGRSTNVELPDDLRARDSAVLILIHPRHGLARLTLIRRTADYGPHGGQISLPGGAVEAFDKTLVDTALRETMEEIGVVVSEKNVLRTLSPLYIPVSNFMVQPFVAFVDHEPEFKPDPREVESVHHIDPMQLIKPEIIVSRKFPTYKPGYNIQAPCFLLEELEIWGATSMILSEFSELLKIKKGQP